MLNLTSVSKCFVASEPIDMRKGYIGLSSYIQESLALDPLSGAWFIFFGKRADRVKIFYWDEVGMCVWYKVLPKGLFRLPKVEAMSYQLSSHELNLLLSGIELTNCQRFSKVSGRVFG